MMRSPCLRSYLYSLEFSYLLWASYCSLLIQEKIMYLFFIFFKNKKINVMLGMLRKINEKKKNGDEVVLPGLINNPPVPLVDLQSASVLRSKVRGVPAANLSMTPSFVYICTACQIYSPSPAS